MEPIDVIREAKQLYVNCIYDGMCFCFTNILITYNYNLKLYMHENIPLFCHQIAVEKFGATGGQKSYWWDEDDRESRIKYFDWLIETYKNKL